MSSYLKKKQIKRFDPNGVGQKGKLFGLPFTPETSELVVIPVPWDVTASFKDGASLGPKAILDVSPQIDLFVPNIPNAWELGICMLPIDQQWMDNNDQARKFSVQYMKDLEGADVKLKDEEKSIIVKNINALSRNINEWVFTKANEILEMGKIPIVLGGDHSSPYGLMKAMASKNEQFGVLQIDAHADLRKSYEGFEHSHASIMHNLLKLESVSTLVQVGIRDYCESEKLAMQNDRRIVTFTDYDMKRQAFEGVLWSSIANQIVAELPDEIYITVDIDGLEPSLCPGTGTPVPGGLSFSQLTYLLDRILWSDKRIIGFDLCEVAGNQSEWDAIVGSRLLYYLANITGASNKLLQLS